MYETKPYFYGTGRRKDSVARVRVYQGTGKVTINDRDIDNYFGLETLKLIVRSPLVLLGLEGKYDVVVRVSGGGVSGQAGAIRHGLSRALLQQSDENRSEGCTACTPVQQALILPVLRFYGSASAEPFLFVRCISCWTGGHDCAGLSVAPKGRDRRAFQIIAQASRGRRGRPSDAPQFSKR